MSDPTPSEVKAANTSLGDLLGEVTKDLSTLIRQEVALAKAELRASAARRPRASASGRRGLRGGNGGAVPVDRPLVGPGTLIGGGWAGRRRGGPVGRDRARSCTRPGAAIKKIEGAPQTVESLKEIPETLRRNEENR